MVLGGLDVGAFLLLKIQFALRNLSLKRHAGVYFCAEMLKNGVFILLAKQLVLILHLL